MTCKLRVDGDVNEDDNYWETYSRFQTEGYEAAGKGSQGNLGSPTIALDSDYSTHF